MITDRWSKPAEDVRFDDILPLEGEIPERHWTGMSVWTGALYQWKFLHKFDPNFLQPKEGIDRQKAIEHIMAVLGTEVTESRKPYKEAAVSFLMSKWFELPDLFRQQEAFENIHGGTE